MKRRIALPAPLSNDTIQRLRAAIMAGLPNGRCLMSLRRFEASIDRLAAALDAAVRADEPAALDDGLASVLGAQRQKLQVPDGVGAGPRYQQLMAAWQGKTMPDEQRPIFERHLATDAVQGRLRATHPELAQALQPFARKMPDAIETPDDAARSVTMSRIEASIDRVADAVDAALVTDEPRTLDETMNLVLAAQQRLLDVPDGAGGDAKFQQLTEEWLAKKMPDEQRGVFERNRIAVALRFRLRSAHPELSRRSAPLGAEEIRLMQEMEQLAPALREAQAHTVPGMITPAWLDRLAHELDHHRVLLKTAAPDNKYRTVLCYAMASAAWALGRGLDQISRPREARDAYAEAARLYAEAGEPEDEAAATEQATWLNFSLTADIDGASFEDLRGLTDGIADPLERAYTLNRLAGRAWETNDQAGGLRYANATAIALADAGFADPQSGDMADVLSGWVTEAIARRTGQAVPKLLKKIGDMALGILGSRHADQIRTGDPAAAATEATVAKLSEGLLAIMAQMEVVTAEVHEGLLPYIPNLRSEKPPEATEYERALALWPRVNAITAAASAKAEPDESVSADAAAIVAEAIRYGQPGLTASACLAQAQVLARRKEAVASDAAAAGEAALLANVSGPENLTNPTLFSTFLTLRGLRVKLAEGAGDWPRLLELAEGAIRAIEAARYRNSDPFQQAAYLAERTLFYEIAAVAAFELHQWDNLIAVMDLFRSRSALRNRLAPPPDESVAALAEKVALATREIEEAPKDADGAVTLQDDNDRVVVGGEILAKRGAWVESDFDHCDGHNASSAGEFLPRRRSGGMPYPRRPRWRAALSRERT